MDILRNKEGELTLDETKFLHQYNKQLEKLKKMILVRKPGYIRYEKLKSFFAYRPEVQTQSIGEIVGQYNNVEDTIESNEISNENKQLEDSLKAQVERELNEQTVEPVASAPIEEQKVEVDVPTTEPVTEQKVEPTVEQAPVAQEKDNNKNNFNVDETIKRANVLVEKAAKADKLETKVTELTKTVGEKDKEIQKLQTEKAKMSEDMQKKENDWKQQIQRVRNELDQLTKNFGLAEKENETLKQQLTDVNNAKQELEEKYNNVMQNLQNVMAENEKLNTFVESITPVLNSVTIDYEDQPHVK
jgi:chromosome segregation ATPase